MGMLSFVCNATSMFRNSRLQFPTLPGDIAVDDIADIVDDPILPVIQDDLDAKLVGGIILLFAHDVTDANRKAATNSVLFAQLVATKRLSQGQCQNAAQWHRAYADSLLRLGWPSMSFDFNNHRFSEGTFSISRQILADVPSLPDVRGTDLGDRVGRMLDSLEAAGPESDLSRVFSQFHNSCSKNAFSVGVVTQDPIASAPILNIVAFEMNREIRNLRSVFMSYTSRSVSLKTARARLILNLRIYNRIESVLEQKLGDRVRNYVLDIPSDKNSFQLTSERPLVTEPHDPMGPNVSRNENTTFSQGGTMSRTRP